MSEAISEDIPDGLKYIETDIDTKWEEPKK